MKTLKMNHSKILMCLLPLFGAALNASAQTQTWEYGDLTSGISNKEAAIISAFPRDPKIDIQNTLRAVKFIKNASEARTRLLMDAKRIVGYSSQQGNKLLLSQSLAAGITLASFMDDAVVKQGPVVTPAGTIRQEVRILKHAFEMAAKYYEKDALFLNKVLDPKKCEELRSKDWVFFGKELYLYISKMSEGILNAKANYALNRWALGVFQRKIMDDLNRNSYSEAILQLNDQLVQYPDLIHDGNLGLNIADIYYIDYTRKLKLLGETLLLNLGNN